MCRKYFSSVYFLLFVCYIPLNIIIKFSTKYKGYENLFLSREINKLVNNKTFRVLKNNLVNNSMNKKYYNFLRIAIVI